MLEEAVEAIVTAAGSAMVGAMATDAWDEAKSLVARLLGRGDSRRVEAMTVQLEEDATLVAKSGNNVIDAVRAELVPVWRRRLADFIEANPEAASELQAFVERVEAQLPARQQAWFRQYNQASSGGTVIAHQGTGTQRIYYQQPSRYRQNNDESDSEHGQAQ